MYLEGQTDRNICTERETRTVEPRGKDGETGRGALRETDWQPGTDTLRQAGTDAPRDTDGQTGTDTTRWR